MSKALGMRWLFIVAGATMLLAVAAACTETVEVPGETVVVEKEVIKEDSLVTRAFRVGSAA